ncbi:MAG: hypothetical protein QOE90_1953 [Thermoplasmata archaeon]|jgi:hypothetical protein|nr:hypothetical protein [Thermoplasmata archaeon]
MSAPPGLPPFTRSLLTWSFVVALAPPLLLIGALASRQLVWLDYVHVIVGGTWTGFDIYMGVVMTRILRALEPPGRVEVAKRLTPTTFFILPSLASVAITSGIYLAQATGRFDLHSPWILAAGVVVLALTAQGFGIFLPNGVRIFLELAKAKPDVALIGKLTMRNVRLAGVQAVMQVALIAIMAQLRWI